jgi:hypothetical protein
MQENTHRRSKRAKVASKKYDEVESDASENNENINRQNSDSSAKQENSKARQIFLAQQSKAKELAGQFLALEPDWSTMHAKEATDARTLGKGLTQLVGVVDVSKLSGSSDFRRMKALTHRHQIPSFIDTMDRETIMVLLTTGPLQEVGHPLRFEDSGCTVEEWEWKGGSRGRSRRAKKSHPIDLPRKLNITIMKYMTLPTLQHHLTKKFMRVTHQGTTSTTSTTGTTSTTSTTSTTGTMSTTSTTSNSSSEDSSSGSTGCWGKQLTVEDADGLSHVLAEALSDNAGLVLDSSDDGDLEEQLNEECDQQMKDDEGEAEEGLPPISSSFEEDEHTCARSALCDNSAGHRGRCNKNNQSAADSSQNSFGDSFIEAMEGLDNEEGQSFVNRDEAMEEDSSSATEAEAELLLQLNRRRQESPKLHPVPGVSYSDPHESAVY